MHADAVPLHKILNSNLQMVIPIFQREYSWELEQVRILWDDIAKLYKNMAVNSSSTHFLGPIVRVEVSQSSVDTRLFYLIDGQQRIITLMVLLSCIRNFIKGENEDILRKIESGYLLNYEEKGENRYKLIPSEGDRGNFKKIISGDEELSGSKLKDTYDFFTKKLSSQKDELNLEILRGVIINNLILVNIDVDKTENPYLIFESLNAKGTPLTQADLIRNYVFMKISGEDKQKELYRNYWRPMEVLLKNELENFFWRYSLKEGTFVKISRTYANLKMELETNTEKSAESELKKLYEYSKFYRKLIVPSEEDNVDIRVRLIRLNRWEIGTAYPFLLNIYKDYSEGKISQEQFCEILDIVESFVVRRSFCKEPTNKLNNLFIALYKQIDKNNFIESMKSNLLRDWPDNEIFTQGLKTFTIYRSGTEKCRLVLESLETSYSHKEKLDLDNKSISIEHVMPRVNDDPEALPAGWKSMLGENYREVHSRYLHTLANLTLTGYNQELSVRPFEKKKELLKESHFELNRFFDLLNKWDEEEILKRQNVLTEKALNIWKYPKIKT